MKITRIAAYRVELPLHEGSYKLVGRQVGHASSTARSSRSRPTPGIVGYGEVCPLGPFYLPAYADGVRAGIAELGPHLIGEDPTAARRAEPPDGRGAEGASVRQVGASTSPAGTSSARSPGLPVCMLLGGRYGEDFVALPGDLAGVARGDGRRRSPAIGPRATAGSSSRSAATRTSTSTASAPWPAVLEPGDRLVADANTGWLHARGRCGSSGPSATSTSTSSSPA